MRRPLHNRRRMRDFTNVSRTVWVELDINLRRSDSDTGSRRNILFEMMQFEGVGGMKI